MVDHFSFSCSFYIKKDKVNLRLNGINFCLAYGLNKIFENCTKKNNEVGTIH